ncbi:hypothetical protein [Celeribacter baekdonensis]|nr:hypothetical protein [Celeribacter baekdonensis]
MMAGDDLRKGNMSMKYGLVLVGLMALAGCADPMAQVTPEGFMTEVPEGVLQLAAPDQNLNAVQLNPEDGCFWYQHVGPVETTMLPLRTPRGNVICAQQQEPQLTAM